MDLTDLVTSLAIYGPLGLPLLYVLTILLRVSCHYVGVEIPALGRAFFTTTAAALLTVLVGLLLQYDLVGADGRPHLVLQFLVFALALAANLLITTGLYHLLLGVRYAKAFSLWLFQAALFGVLALIFGCCGGMLMMFWERA